MYKIKTDQFEGPISLLLELIEKRKLDITQLSLAKVTDDFLEFIENKDNINLNNLTEFLVVAAQLILIKSKALLPLFEITPEEEEDLQNLEERLVEYRRFKQIALQLEKMFEQKQVAFSKKEEEIVTKGFIDPQLKPVDLQNAFNKLIKNNPSEEELKEETLLKVISLEEKMVHLKSFLQKRIKVAFGETVAVAKNKTEVVVTFLAVLEMVKRKTLFVSQSAAFEEIFLEKRKIDKS
ncbi:MAG TPA: segregation/condensation protein A [Candidatus Moranbacteria bacterium]|nr:segregation/condensation protein A [Candidatus Moranbacteria bacterium]